MKEDIDSIMKRPSHWSRSKSLLSELCSQTNQKDILIPIEPILKYDLNKIFIFILFLSPRQSFHLYHSKIKIKEFDDIQECVGSIKDTSSSHIYLIVSMSKYQDIRSVIEFDSVHAVYVVTDLESNELIQTMSNYSKLSGIFVLNEDLLDQLVTDICFYRQIQCRLPNMNIFNLDSNILNKLNEHQTDFLCFQLFSGILSELPIPSTISADSNTQNDHRLLTDFIEANTKINILFKDFNSSTLQDSTKTLKDINQRIVSLAKNIDPSFNTVYRAQVVAKTDFKMLQDNSDALLAIQTFVLASRSFQSVVDICRRAVDNQLNVVLFELKLSDEATIVNLDSDTVVFSLGTLFRLVSTEAGADGVWYAQLESADDAMQSITDQLRFETGGQLTWLTFGNYLTAFKRFDAAKNYYEYLLLVLPSTDRSLSSIHNNMGLMYLEMNDRTEALQFFKKASELPINNSTTQVEDDCQSTPRITSSKSSAVENIDILIKIAEISDLQGNKNTALEYYRRAQNIEPNATLRKFYQDKIDKILSTDDV
ncbi:unnamed protein product [Rotaria sp. Silwood1]|nr:unnamed protein product [Rotaria sp. Silwood1]CAF1655981.1 unnamed protein product [Rotaria sp. Silwood1]CAF3859928.1 unnamed protein product [Rotaria sp. Silwood1]CAF4880716.1 unnamed protein product [Rotaria sp. Silwood1]